MGISAVYAREVDPLLSMKGAGSPQSTHHMAQRREGGDLGPENPWLRFIAALLLYPIKSVD